MRQLTKLNERELAAGQSGSKSSWHEQYRDSAWVFAGGLPFDLTEGDILAVFSQYGEPSHVNLVRDRTTGKSKGFGFICYEDQRSTDLAVDNFNGIELCGRKIRVDHCADYRVSKHELNSAADHVDMSSDQSADPAHLSLSLVSAPPQESSSSKGSDSGGARRERDKQLPPSQPPGPPGALSRFSGASNSPPTRAASGCFDRLEATRTQKTEPRDRTLGSTGNASGERDASRRSAHANSRVSPDRNAQTGHSERRHVSRDNTESRNRRSRSKDRRETREAVNSKGAAAGAVHRSTERNSTSTRKKSQSPHSHSHSRHDSKRSRSRDRRKSEHKRRAASPIRDALRSNSSSRSRSRSSSRSKRHTSHRERKHHKS